MFIWEPHTLPEICMGLNEVPEKLKWRSSGKIKKKKIQYEYQIKNIQQF